MNFNQPQLMWLGLFALIPWIIYLLQLLFGKTRPLPSLIFIQEYRKKKIKRNRRFLIYLLQSLLLLGAAVLISQPSLTVKKEGNFCLVDDLVHTQWNQEKWEKVKLKLISYCRQGFYSLASMASNRIEKVNEKYMMRLNEVLLQNIFILLKEKIQSEKKLKQVIFIAPKNHYKEKVFSILKGKLKVVAVDITDKKNIFFKHVKVALNPLDFRKRDIVIEANSYAAGKTVIIEKGNTKFNVELDSSAKISISLDVNFDKPFEPLILTLQGDKFINDNQYFSLIEAKKPIQLYLEDKASMKVLSATLFLNQANFPYQWFSSKGSVSLKLKVFERSKDFSNVSNTIHVAKLENSSVRFLFNSKKIFRDYYLKNTLDISRLNLEGYDIVERFTDNLPAVIKWPKLKSGFILFDPDSAQKNLMLTPQYPIFLLQSILKIVYSNIQSELSISETGSNLEQYAKVGFHFSKVSKTVRSVSQFFAKIGSSSSLEDISLSNYHTSSMIISKQDIPQSMIIHLKENVVGFDIRNIIYFILTLLLLAIFFLEMPNLKNKN